MKQVTTTNDYVAQFLLLIACQLAHGDRTEEKEKWLEWKQAKKKFFLQGNRPNRVAAAHQSQMVQFESKRRRIRQQAGRRGEQQGWIGGTKILLAGTTEIGPCRSKYNQPKLPFYWSLASHNVQVINITEKTLREYDRRNFFLRYACASALPFLHGLFERRCVRWRVRRGRKIYIAGRG